MNIKSLNFKLLSVNPDTVAPDEAAVMQTLTSMTSEGVTAHVMAEKDPADFGERLKMLNPGNLMEILKLKNPYGLSVAHVLAPKTLLTILDTLPDSDFKAIMNIKSDGKESVAFVLVRCSPKALLTLLETLPSLDLVKKILNINDNNI